MKNENQNARTMLNGNEVTESEKWENVSMSIYSNALQRGLEDGKIIGQEIADELEEDAALIRSICELASSFAPEYDSKMVIDAWMHANNL